MLESESHFLNGLQCELLELTLLYDLLHAGVEVANFRNRINSIPLIDSIITDKFAKEAIK